MIGGQRIGARCAGVGMAAAMALALCVAGTVGAVAQESMPYRLSAGDTLTVQIVAWQAEETEAEVWSSLSRDYVINAEGELSMALVGFVPAAGETLRALSATIATTLQDRFGLRDAPGVSLGVSAFAPVYVLGDVARPGPYQLPPGASVLQALGLAGGLSRPGASAYATGRHEIDAAAERAAAQDALIRLVAREARLLAEYEGTGDGGAIAQALAGRRHPEGPEAIRRIVADESRALEMSQSGFDAVLAGFDRLDDLLVAEVAAIERKLDTQRERAEVLSTVVAELDQLAGRGLVRSERLLDIQSAQASLESGTIDLEQALFEARTRIAEVADERARARTERREAALARLAEVRARLPALRATIAAAADREALARTGAGRWLEAGPGGRAAFTIQRRGPEAGATEIAATAQTPLAPSDVLIVALPAEGGR